VAADTWTWADVDGQVQPRTATVDLCLDGTIQAQLEDARRRLKEARRDDALDASSGGPSADVKRLEKAAVKATRTFEVVSCGWRRWRELQVAHPYKGKDGAYRWDASTFVPAALAECVVQFTSEEQAVKACDKLTPGQVLKLFVTVQQVNEGDDTVPIGRGG
jgi:hypothetical protein